VHANDVGDYLSDHGWQIADAHSRTTIRRKPHDPFTRDEAVAGLLRAHYTVATVA
jgi:hypothetical protein